MKQITQNYKTGELTIDNVPVPIVSAGHVIVQNAFSLISAGTERSSIELSKMSLVGKAKSRPADFKKVINLAKKQGIMNAYKAAMSRLDAPTPLGYSSAGIVLEVGSGVEDIKPGDQVACAGAKYANHAEVISVPQNLCARIPQDVPLDWAAFATLGAIALQGVRQSESKVGDCVAVIGLGLIGQLTIQLLKASGCRVIGIDLEQDKVKSAVVSGADAAILRNKDVETVVEKMTNGYGVDAVIITAATKSNDPFLLAPEIARDRARVVLVGVAKIDFPREPYYRKELSVTLARSYGPGRYDPNYEENGIDYPIGYVRWTEKRNMEAVLQLMAEKKLNVAPLITHKFKIDDAQRAYDLILGKTKEPFLGVLFQYDTAKKQETKIQIKSVKSEMHIPQSEIRIGFIGTGSFAQTSLLPNVIVDKSKLIAVADTQGHIAKHVASKYNADYCTSDYKEILADKYINTVFIATRHNLHAQLIIESLEAGKHVFCEKPLCLNAEQLQGIVKSYSMLSAPCPLLLIGFNRRFAPLSIKAKGLLGDKIGPYIINYRVNAGMLPDDHWLLDPEQGGGRIIGEVCHFIDFISYFTNSRIEQVFAHSLSGSKTVRNDNIIATIKYEDGSIGSISYFAVGDKDFPKERIEIFGDQKAVVIDDFRKLEFSIKGKKLKKAIGQDKGYKNEITTFFHAIKSGQESPVEFEKILEATLTTFAINESIRSGDIINLI